ncbi:putative 8-oxoguanine DNA glycosylase [Babesia divergens]|uniref:DNA-(apurinic or apyrimidinic site) lyase n=1 Tax=Babesia divergens TaxID=32595 RepID=A0AAD9GFC6_BABDI|nr:putative 8-oxoguanine DNA glycosylase [Babesia divergens]
MDPSLLLTTGQSFSWKLVAPDLWAGVIHGSALEVRKVEERVEFRVLFGNCSDATIRDYFDLGHVYQLDRKRAPASMLRVVDRLDGVRILQQEPLETLISFICSANNNIKRITKLCFGLRERYGTYIGSKSYDDGLMKFYAFPNLKQLEAATLSEMRALGLGYRATYLSRTISALSEGAFDVLLGLRERPPEEAQPELLKFHGVGRKVADCIMLFGLGKREVVPVDVHVKKIVKEHFGIKVSSDMSYTAAQDAFKSICPKDAGWLQAVLFIDSVLKGTSK